MEDNSTPKIQPENEQTADVPQPTRQPDTKKAGSQRRNNPLLIAVLVLGVALLGSLQLRQQFSGNQGEVTPRQTVSEDGNKLQTKTEADIANIVSKVSPSVVSVTTQSQAQTFFGIA